MLSSNTERTLCQKEGRRVAEEVRVTETDLLNKRTKHFLAIAAL